MKKLDYELVVENNLFSDIRWSPSWSNFILLTYILELERDIECTIDSDIPEVTAKTPIIKIKDFSPELTTQSTLESIKPKRDVQVGTNPIPGKDNFDFNNFVL